MKKCNTCLTEKIETEFPKKLKSVTNICKDCTNKWHRNRYADNKANIYKRRTELRKRRLHALRVVVEKLKERPCKDCELEYPPWIMEFDHIKNKKYNVANMVQQGMPLQKVLDEIAKCEIVCSNCHRDRTYWRRIGSRKA